MAKSKFIILIYLLLVSGLLTAQTFNWALSVDSEGDDEVCQVVYKNNVIHAVGFMGGRVDFDPSGLTSALEADGVQDVYVASYTDQKKLIKALKLTSGSGKYVNNNGVEESFSGGIVFPYDFCLDNEGNYYVVGSFKKEVNFNPGGEAKVASSPEGDGSWAPYSDIFIAKYSQGGILQWLRTMGGESTDAAKKIELDKNGNVYVQGTYYGSVDFNPDEGGDQKFGINSEYGNSFVTKLSSDGSYQWTKTYYSFKSDGVSAGRLIINDFKLEYETGDFYFGGHFAYKLYLEGNDQSTISLANDRSGKYSGFIAKYNSDGDLQWASEAIKGQNESLCYVYGITIGQENKIYITGYMGGTGTFTNGTSLTVDAVSWGGFAASINSSTAMANWAVAYNEGSDHAKIMPQTISVSEENEIFIAGRFSETMTLPINGSTDVIATPSSSGSTRIYDIFLFKLSSNGVLTDYRTIGGPGDDGYPGNPVLGDNKELYLMGDFVGTANFNIQDSLNPAEITSVGNDAGFIARFDNMLSKSSGKSILSYTYAPVDEANLSIEVPLGQNYKTFTENIGISDLATFVVYDQDSNVVDNESTAAITENSYIILTAENQTQKTYTLTVSDGNDILTSDIGLLNTSGKAITQIPPSTSVAQLLDGLTVSYGAEITVFVGEQPVENTADFVTSDMTIQVTSIEDKSKTYTLKVLLTGNEILTAQIGSVDTTNKIVYVPTNSIVADFIAGLTLSDGASAAVWNSETETADQDTLFSDYEVRVTSESGSENTYFIEVVENAQGLILSTDIGLLNSVSKNILNVPSSITLSALRAALTISEGATLTFYDTETDDIITDEEQNVSTSTQLQVKSLTGESIIYTLTLTSSAMQSNKLMQGRVFYSENTSELVVDLEDEVQHFSVMVYTTSGKTVLSAEASNTRIPVHLQPGIYVVNVKSESKSLNTKILVR